MIYYGSDNPLVPRIHYSSRDYDAKRYGTNWVREAYAREKFDHEEMDRLMGIAVEAGDKTEPYPWSTVSQDKWEVHGTPTYKFFIWFLFPESRGSRKHWRWQWGTVSKGTLAGASLVWCALGILAIMVIWPDPQPYDNDVPIGVWLMYGLPALAWMCLGLARGLRWMWRNPPLRRE